MFRTSEVMLINKLDLLKVLKVDITHLLRNAEKVNPSLSIFQVSAATGDGFDLWTEWLIKEMGKKRGKME